MANLNDLKARLLTEVNNGLPFMDGREKGEITLNETMTIIDYGFMNGKDGEFSCFITKEYNDHYFWGGQVLTEKLKKVEGAFTEGEIATLLEEGIQVLFSEKKSANRRRYIDVEFI